MYIWAIRHPASGYVQGINDLLTPFFQVFLHEHLRISKLIIGDPESGDPGDLDADVIMSFEADAYWCLTKLLDGIQGLLQTHIDNYTHAQPGITRQVSRLQDLIRRIDGNVGSHVAPLANHLEKQGIQFIQFAFRWVNCLLMRELSLKNTIRMWDSYQSDGPDAFSEFHLYVCAAFLCKWSATLREMEFGVYL